MCIYPIPAHQGAPGTPPKLHPAIGTANLRLPCGNCIECRIKHAATWGLRCGHHAIGVDHVSFNTLTFNEHHLPNTADKQEWLAHFQRFMKRLRILRKRHPDQLQSDSSKPISFFNCAEYGDRFGRPHFHPLLYNVGFPDLVHTGTSKSGEKQYSSQILTDLWSDDNGEPIGIATHSPTWNPTAAGTYAAKHNLKHTRHRDVVDPETGEVLKVRPFATMSKGIGMEFLKRYRSDMRKGYLNNNGRPVAVPRAYTKWAKEHDPELYEDMQHNIEKALRANIPSAPELDDRHPARRAAREVILNQRQQMYDDAKRTL